MIECTPFTLRCLQRCTCSCVNVRVFLFLSYISQFDDEVSKIYKSIFLLFFLRVLTCFNWVCVIWVGNIINILPLSMTSILTPRERSWKNPLSNLLTSRILYTKETHLNIYTNITFKVLILIDWTHTIYLALFAKMYILLL